MLKMEFFLNIFFQSFEESCKIFLFYSKKKKFGNKKKKKSLIVIYLWLLALNVYLWTHNNINYKLIFKFNYHFSSFIEIIKRAAAFTSVILIMFIWCLISRF